MTARKGDDIAERLLVLSAKSVMVSRALPKDSTGRHIANQLLRCGSAGGANYGEARAAESPADFIHKVGIAAKEVRETLYWLQLIKMTSLTTIDLDQPIDEADQLIAILIASIRTVRRRMPPKPAPG